jgi:hypothetical protein
MSALIVIITKDSVEPECLKSVIAQKCDWIICGQHPKHTHDNPIFRTYLNCAENRESARKMALAHSADQFLFVDSDIILPSNALEEFMKQSQFDVQGGWYKVRNSDRYAGGRWVKDNVFSNFKKIQKSLVLTDLVGLGCAFISRLVLEAVTIKHGTDVVAKTEAGETMIVGECGVLGDDIAKLGFSMYMNGSVVCGHLDR